MRRLESREVRTLGRYRLIGQLGAGGMGQVFLGLSEDGDVAAIKQVHPWLAKNKEFRDRFRREVNASKSVSGAYTAAVLDADLTADVPWLASVYVYGPPLHDAVAEYGPLDPSAVRLMAAGLALALRDIHGAGLVHRDLKPPNVILAEDGPRVIDFGIARSARFATQLTQGGVLGSPGYMSPEQVQGVRDLKPATDFFSLASVLVYASSNTEPFTGNTAAELLYKVVFDDPDLSAVPGDLHDIISPCFTKSPDDRPTTEELLRLIGPIDPGKWPPHPAPRVIREQKDQLRALLSDMKLPGASAALARLLDPPPRRVPEPVPASAKRQTVVHRARPPGPDPSAARAPATPETAGTRSAPAGTPSGPAARRTSAPPRAERPPPEAPAPLDPPSIDLLRTPLPAIIGAPEPERHGGMRGLAIAAVLIAVLAVVAGIVISIVVSGDDAAPAGQPQRCDSAADAVLSTLATANADANDPGRTTERDTATETTCNWAGDGATRLTVSVFTERPDQGEQTVQQRAMRRYTQARDNAGGNTNRVQVGEGGVIRNSTDDQNSVTRLLSYSGDTVVDISYSFANGSDDRHATQDVAVGQLRTLAGNFLPSNGS